MAEKFETFLEEGLLDPLLQYIVKDSEKDGDPKVNKALIIKILAKLRIVFSCENAALQVLMCSVCLSVCLSVVKLKFYSFLASTTFHNSL